MKYLFICEGGNVRSVSAAYVMRQELGRDSLAASARFNTEDTLAILCVWADKVVVLAPEWIYKVHPEHRDNCKSIDIGPDIYGAAFHPDLLNIVRPLCAKLISEETA